MRKSILLLTLAATLALVPASAGAATIRHTGKIVGDDEARVSLKLVKKKGKITKLRDFRVLQLLIRCEGDPYRISDITQLQPAKVNSKGTFRERLKNPDGSVLRISGRVRGGGKRVVGNVKSNEFQTSAGACHVPKQRFKTAKA